MQAQFSPSLGSSNACFTAILGGTGMGLVMAAVFPAALAWLPRELAPWAIVALGLLIGRGCRTRFVFTDDKITRLALTSAVPAGAAAYLYGALSPSAGISLDGYVWGVLAIPVFEELLFRGAVYRVSETWFGKSLTPWVAPLPPAYWASAAAFSAWHAQNFLLGDAPVVLFQMFYTFFAGLWLAWVRDKSTSMTPCILCHALLNLATQLALDTSVLK